MVSNYVNKFPLKKSYSAPFIVYNFLNICSVKRCLHRTKNAIWRIEKEHFLLYHSRLCVRLSYKTQQTAAAAAV